MQTLETLNSKNIDAYCERRFFVSEPIEIEIKGEDIASDAKIPRHPDGAIGGNREWVVGSKIFIQESDYTQGKLRLKDYADIQITGFDADIEGEGRSDGRPIIHWLPKEISREAKMFVPEGEEIRELVGFIEDFELNIGEVYQFERIGFAKLERINGEVAELVWLHG